MTVADQIRQILYTRLGAELVQIEDVSEQHKHHREGGSGHYHLTIVAAQFRHQSLLQQHRLVYSALSDLMGSTIHALALDTYTVEEWQAITREGLTLAEYKMVCDRLQRRPNPVELGMFGVMWSEHCCYKHSRPLLKLFPTTGDRILVGPGENAGVVKITDEIAICFKIESHNRPSAVEPYQGAATGVGGILRDIFTMGARPVAILNSLRFGRLEDSWVRQRVAGVVAGIAGYGNCVGVPTIGGEVYFEAVYDRNPLVNAMAIGILETPQVVKSKAVGIGNPVLYVGATTGRDGIKGASFASAELSDKSQQDRPAVQVGDPFMEKLLIEACLEAFQTGAVVAAQDMGAAGLTCATSEMAARGKVGILLDLDQIPARDSALTPYEYMLSESQERMLFIAQQGREQELIAIFHKWGLHAVVAGRVIPEPVVRIFHGGAVVAEVPAQALAENTPVYTRPLPDTPEYVRAAWADDPDTASYPQDRDHLVGSLCTLLATPSIASKAWIYRQYDHQVQNNTVLLAGQSSAPVIRLRSPNYPIGELEPDRAPTYVGLAATVDCNARYVYLDPERGAQLAVAEAARNLACVGAEPLAVTDNLNFGSPEHDTGYWQLAQACRGIAEACRALDTPVTGGNVSLYNERIKPDGTTQAIYPTPVIGMVGLVPDVRRVCGIGWQQAGDRIYLLGTLVTSLAGSEYLAVIQGKVSGRPLPVDFALERKVQSVCREGIRQGWLRSAHDCAEGGLAVALCEASITAQLGIRVELPSDRSAVHTLFGEGASRIIVSASAASALAWEAYLAEELAGHWWYIGTVTDATCPLEIKVADTYLSLSLSEISDLYYTAIPKLLGLPL
ncbi:MAG: phosphoribosylformylglycinamidine synthase subunit PurL [Pseudanabaenaceae cyanobacterium]